MLPDLDALSLLAVIARTGSLGQAARQTGVTQPAVTARLQTMERQVGVTLVWRSPLGSTLTPAGRLLVEWSRPLLAAAEQLSAAAPALGTNARERAHVAVTSTVAEQLLPGWLAAAGAPDGAEPGPGVEVVAAAAALEQVRAGVVALAVVEGGPTPRGLSARTVATDRLEVVVSPWHPWARRRRALTAAELAATPLVDREPGAAPREAVERALADHDQVAPLVELSTTVAVVMAVAAGEGPAVLSTLVTAREVASGRLVPVPVEGLELPREIRAVWSGKRRPDGALGRLLDATLATVGGQS